MKLDRGLPRMAFPTLNRLILGGIDLQKEVGRVEVADRATKLTLGALSQDLIFNEGLISEEEMMQEGLLDDEMTVFFPDDFDGE